MNLPPHTLSIVVPLYNEAENVLPLVARLHEALHAYPHPWELLLIDDGSTDATLLQCQHAQQRYGPHVRLIALMRNFKQTAAMQAGIDHARGTVIVTMDGDLQNDPHDIPRLVARLLTEDLDLVAGWRKARKDSFWFRTLPSRIANALIARLTGVRLHDYGCSLKAYRADVLKNVVLYGEMHRFIPAWLATVTHPTRIAEEIVTHHPRRYGRSKYGLSRTVRVLLDLLFVFFFMRYRTRPGHFFGGLGLLLLTIGGGILTYLLLLKLLADEAIGQRPLLSLGFFLLLSGVQFLTTGVLAEMVTRIYHESTDRTQYQIRLLLPSDVAWKTPTAPSPPADDP
ncbi:MAG: glycosyltransferase family 2 protein [Hydrogenophilus sp.]|nr:glycosyltransferase family 2 protein [Hydrogenophilus sp.]